MSEVNLSFTIRGDSEGYVTFECPFCGSEFKLNAGEVQDEDNPIGELFCPYCGLTNQYDKFYSEEVIEKINIILQNYAADMINKALGKTAKSINSSNSIIKMDFKPLKKLNAKEIIEKDTVETEFTCNCCGQHVKVLYSAGASKIFCPYCGVDL